jgi:hypothetical protein
VVLSLIPLRNLRDGAQLVTRLSECVASRPQG